MCAKTVCQHDSDPAVQWLERDYQYMVMKERGGTPVVVDSRIPVGSDSYGLWWDHDAEGEVIDSVSHAQPMYTLKGDEGWTQPMRWDAFEGPMLPFEGEMTIGQADEERPDWYRQRLYYHYTGSGMPVPEEIQAWHDEWEAARAERERVSRERWEAARRQEQPLTLSHAVSSYINEQLRLTSDSLEQIAESMREVRFDGIISTTTAEDSSGDV